MNFDDVMNDWQSQDAPSRQGFNEALLAKQLRQEEAKVQQSRRRERWITCGAATIHVLVLGRLFFIMIHRDEGSVLSGWDYAIPVVGGVAALLWARVVYTRQRAQAVREQRFGDSLRDQINRQLAQCDYAATSTRMMKRLPLRLLSIFCVLAVILANGRIHNRTLSDTRLWGPIALLVCWFIVSVGGIAWVRRVFVQRRILPRKRQLEAMLKELDGQ